LLRKTLSGIILPLLLISSLSLVFNVKPVATGNTIYIRSDGSVDPPTAPIQRDGDIYTFTDNINDSIVVERNNIIVDGASYTLQGTGAWLSKGITLSGRNNVTIKSMTIKAFCDGIYLMYSSNNSIAGNNITSSWEGIFIDYYSSNNSIIRNNVTNSTNNGIGIHNYSSNNSIIENNVTNNWYGFGVGLSSNNSIHGNNITNNHGGIRFDRASNNKFYHNNFINNTKQVDVTSGYANMWDDGYPSGGNYWSDYTDVDLYSGLYQNETGSDDIWDHPYVIDENNKDRYPLVKPWTTPASGKGIWIWRLSEAEGGNVSAIIEKCKKVGIKWIAIKCGDGTQFWDWQCAPPLITEFHNAGIKFLGWQYVYGDDPVSEADVANQILDAGTDGLIIDAETEYEGKPDNATLYLEKIRKEHPESFLAYTTFPIIDYHLNFPYLEFGKYCDVVMPQDYWKEIGVTPEEMIKWMEEQWDKWHKIWKEGGYGASIKPVIPLGQGWDVTGSEIARFCYLVYEHGYDGVGLWRYDTMSEENWEAYASTPINTSTGTGITYFRTDTGIIKNLKAVNESDLPTEGKPNIQFPHGFFSFSIARLEVGGTVYVTIVFPENIPTTAQYWKYQEPEGWHQIPMLSNDGDNVVVIELTDGGLGDDDAVTNGIIVDVGGVGYPTPPLHDVAVTNITFSKQYLTINETIYIYVTIENRGNLMETFDVGVNYTRMLDPLIGTQTIILAPGESIQLNFTWTLTDSGRYEIKAYTSTIPDDVNPSDNIIIAYVYVVSSGSSETGGVGGSRHLLT